MLRELRIERNLTKRSNLSLGLYLSGLKKYVPLEPEEEATLASKKDITSRNKLVEANLKFVVSVVILYQGLGVN